MKQPALDRRMEIGNQRLVVVNEMERLLLSNLPIKGLAKQHGVSLQTLRSWAKAYSQSGFPGLLPRWNQSGRQSALTKIDSALSLEQADELHRQVKGLAYDLDSPGLAWRVLARRDETPEVVRGILDAPRRSKHHVPRSLVNAAKISEVESMAHRGPRKLGLNGMYTPRKLDILPGDVYSSDDTTPIWAWWIPWFKSPEYPHGVKLLQGQFLPMIDVASQHILCYALIARESSSYRACDIWALFGHTFDLVGLPRIGLQLERGSWESNLVQGVETETDYQGVSLTMRVGGLRMLPTRILPWHEEHISDFNIPKTLKTFTSYLPKSKSIEGLFHRLQKFEGTIYGALGRDQMRNPFEKAKKIYEACRRGAADPRLHFLSGPELITRLNAAIEMHEAEDIEGQVFSGRPADVWEKAMRQHGPGANMPENLRYLYRRDWSRLTIRKGHAYVRRNDAVTGKTIGYFYCNPEVFAQIDGQEVLVYFDRENFEKPAQIVNLSGEHICQAAYEARVGMFFGEDLAAHDFKKRYRGAVMTLYSDVAAYIPSRQVPGEIADRRRQARITQVITDGHGTTIRKDSSPTVESVPSVSQADEAPAFTMRPRGGMNAEVLKASRSEWREEMDERLAKVNAFEESERMAGRLV